MQASGCCSLCPVFRSFEFALDCFSSLEIVLWCVYVVHVASCFSQVWASLGCLDSHVYLGLLNLCTLHDSVIGCFRSFFSVVGNVQVVQVVPVVLGRPFALF